MLLPSVLVLVHGLLHARAMVSTRARTAATGASVVMRATTGVRTEPAAVSAALAAALAAAAAVPAASEARAKGGVPAGRAASSVPAATTPRGSPAVDMRERERALYASGCECVVGVDEAGRGPLAGPVVAAACFIPVHVEIRGIADSKALSEAAREAIYAELTSHADVAFAVSIQPPAVIDKVNILQATLLAMRESVHALRARAPGLDYVLVDGNRSPFDADPAGIRCEAVVKGDARCLCVAAASIIAKVTRDRLMVEMDRTFPLFEFARHKGYPTARHVALLAQHGPCVEHRRSFAPVRDAEFARQARRERDQVPSLPRDPAG